jgi:hypothetical protein
MEKSIMLILIGSRRESAVQVQQTLTDMGCFIKTRLGLHDGTPEECTNTGLIILELMGDTQSKSDLYDRLKAIPRVNVQLVELSI